VVKLFGLRLVEGIFNDGAAVREDEHFLLAGAEAKHRPKPNEEDEMNKEIRKQVKALEKLRLPSVRLEHVQFIDEAQARRARDLGLALCMQPNFSVESRDYADRLPESHLRSLNPFRMLIDRVGFQPGKDLLFGSDGMPHGAAAAWQWGLFPVHEGQRLSSEELSAGYGPALPGGKTVLLVVDEETKRVESGDTTPNSSR